MDHLQPHAGPSSIAILGTYPPRRCGIATYSADLVSALSTASEGLRLDVVAVTDEPRDYPAEVVRSIPVLDRQAYSAAARMLNVRKIDLLSIQHEYGIFGGEAGRHLLELVRSVQAPIVTTLHTVSYTPTAEQFRVMEELIARSARIVVMSRSAIKILSKVHALDPEKIDFIPHGIPAIPASAGVQLRAQMGGKGPILLTFGLLSPDKGIEHVIQAMPAILEIHPEAQYWIVGATHPQVRATAGESYRTGLVELAERIGVAGSVHYVDEFVSLDTLIAYLSATDFYITPYLNPVQITSGTLAYSLGAGKGVISTPYEYAKEVLADGRGQLVPFANSAAISEAVLSSLGNPEGLREMGSKAAAYGDEMLWSRVAVQYLASFEKAAAPITPAELPFEESAPRHLPDLRYDHLDRLSDDTGILQHARFDVPHRAEGYCVDDNARALLLCCQLDRAGSMPPRLKLLQTRCLSFVEHAYYPALGRFRNFMSYSRDWLEDQGSEDSHGRSLWALGEMSNSRVRSSHSDLAHTLFQAASRQVMQFSSPRAWAYSALGAVAVLEVNPNCQQAQDLLEFTASSLSSLHLRHATRAWPWMEPRLAYANARIPQAMILAGCTLGRSDLKQIGIESLQWLMDGQEGPGGRFSPVGAAGAGPSDFGEVLFDQQPIEAWSSVSACLTASKLGGGSSFLHRASWCFEWFLGGNVLGIPLANVQTGGCFDGLEPTGPNQNQGSESTLAYLCALHELRQATGDLLRFPGRGQLL